LFNFNVIHVGKNEYTSSLLVSIYFVP